MPILPETKFVSMLPLGLDLFDIQSITSENLLAKSLAALTLV